MPPTIVLTGASGFVGTHVLLHLLSLPTPLTIYLPLRTPLPASHPALSHPAWSSSRISITQLIRPDLLAALSDPSDSELRSALACAHILIYTIGVPWPKMRALGLVTYVTLEHTLALAFAGAFAPEPEPASESTTPTAGAQPGTHKAKTLVYCSGRFTRRPGEKRLSRWLPTYVWMSSEVKGAIERDLLELGKGRGMQVRLVRPGGISPPGGAMERAAAVMTGSLVRVDVLARAMCELGMQEGEEGEKDTWENWEIVRTWAKP